MQVFEIYKETLVERLVFFDEKGTVAGYNPEKSLAMYENAEESGKTFTQAEMNVFIEEHLTYEYYCNFRKAI